MTSEHNRPPINDVDKIKQEILSELDTFLLEANNTNPESVSAVEKARILALKELDRLIKQDLSYGEILHRLKSRQEIKPASNTEISPGDFYSSIHVVDLRHEFEVKKPKKNGALVKFFSKSKKQEPIIDTNEVTAEVETEELITVAPAPISNEATAEVETEDHNTEEIVETENANKLADQASIEPASSEAIEDLNEVEPSEPTNFRLVFKKSILIALTTLVILLPVQVFVFVGKWQQDKNKLLNYGQSGWLAFQSGIIKASSNNYQEADIDFSQALSEFDDAQNILSKYDQQLLNIGDKIPLIGDTLKSGENVLAISSSLSEAAKIISQKREQATDLTDYIIVLNQQLDELLPLLEDTNKRLDKIVGLPDNIQAELTNLKKELPSVISNLKNLKVITTTLESLLGSEKEQRYLLLFQNNNEIRATGGFIGSYALLDVNKGKIVQLEIPQGGTYDLTAGQKKKWRSPQALTVVNTTFNIWDANWWPDFPTSAKKISQFFSESGGSSVDGVIAINATVLQKLLVITGPLDFPEYNTQINADNVIDVLQAEIEGKRNSENPKTIISDLAPKILQKIFDADNAVEDMFGLLAEVLQKKDLQVYSTDQNIDKQISLLGWRGEIMETDRDYLWVISTNIAGGKTDLKVNQLIDHQAEVQANGEIINTVKITRSYDGSFDDPFLGLEGNNVSYLRVYVPKGSKLLSAVGFDAIPQHYFPDNKQYDIDPDLVQEESKLIDNESQTEIFSSLNRTVFANWQTLKANETKTVTITYQLPFSLDLGSQLTNDWKKIFLASNRHFDHYSLLVQSQSGQAKSILNSKIIFPKDTKIIWEAANSDNSVQVQNNQTVFSQNLDSDQYFGVVINSQ